MKTKKWKTYKHLKSEEAISAYLSESFADGTPAEITSALSDAIRAHKILLADTRPLVETNGKNEHWA
jgi:DNA-binding phage protein